LDVDRIRRAGPGTQLAADALLQRVRPAVELMPTVEPGRGDPWPVGIVDGECLAEHRLEGDSEARHRVEEAHQPRPSPGSSAPSGPSVDGASSALSTVASSGSTWSPIGGTGYPPANASNSVSTSCAALSPSSLPPPKKLSARS